MNYVIGRSAFGDYWINRTEQPVEGKKNFPTFEEAKEEAMALNDSVENQIDLDKDEEEYFEEEEGKFLRKEMYKWLI